VARIETAQRHARRVGHPGFVACQPMWGLAVPDREALQRLSQPLPTIPIIGASRPEQLRESVRACSLRLGAEELAALRAA
jgi:hypothetical protein